MTAEVRLYERLTEVEVCALPPDDPEYRHFAVWVRHRTGDRWVVMRDDRHSLNRATGRFEYDRCPDGVALDDWAANHWFDYDTAVALARNLAPRRTCNGFTVDDVRAWRAKAAIMEAT